MTDRHNRLPYYGGVRGGERLVGEDLRGFHMCVSAEDAVDSSRTKRWQDISSPRLRQDTDVDLTAEAAWALLARWEGMSASDEVAMGDDVLRALVRGLIATMPPLTAWLRYVKRFPSGEAMEGFRRHRRETILRWFPHVHPDSLMLAEYVRDDPTLSTFVRAGISAHIQGPYHCFTCRSAERNLSPASQGVGASQRVAAATAADEPHKHEAIVRVRGTEYRFRVSFLVDGNFLRVFVCYEGERTLPRIAMKLAVVFASSHIREGSIIYPDHGLIGANLGPLQELSIDDIVSFSLEP